MNRVGLKLLFLAGTSLVASQAFAQESSVAASAEAGGSQERESSTTSAQAPDAVSTGDIIVTARRRGESQMRVPVVMSVQNAETIARYNAVTLSAISSLTPTVVIATFANQGGGTISIRGIGSPANQVGFEQAVSVALDGIQTSSGRAAAFGFLDVQQVETLKGPQALFFGKNSTAGVISFTSKGPGDRLEATALGSYGFVADEVIAFGAISGPISDTLGVRLAVQYRNMGGWLRNTAGPLPNPFYNPATGEPASIAQVPGAADRRPGERELLGRFTAVYKPYDGLSATLKVFGATADDEGAGVSTQNIGPCSGPFPRVNGFADTTGDCVIDNRTTIGATPTEIARTFRTVSTDGRPHGKLNVFLASLAIEADLGSINVSTNTGYIDARYKGFSGFDQSTYSQVAVAERPKQRDFTQEIRLQSDFRSKINGMIGVFYQNTRLSYENESKLNDSTFYNPAANRYSAFQSLAKQDGEAISVFGQVRYAPTDTLDLTAGARWTHERKNFQKRNLYGARQYDTAAAVYLGSDEVGVQKGRFSDSNVSPEVTVTWHPNPNFTLFGAYRTGFKSGGFALGNPLTATSPVRAVQFDSETAKGFEIGTRGRWLDGHGTFSAAFFRYTFSNLQVSLFDATIPSYILSNAGAVKQVGFELESSVNITPEFSLRGAFSYVRNRFRGFTGQCYTFTFPAGTTRATAMAPPNCSFVDAASLTLQQRYDGRTPARSPTYSGNAGFVYRQPVGNLVAEATGDAFYSSSYYAAETLAEQTRQPAYWKFNASINISPEDERWKLSLIGRNLTNKYVLVYATDRVLGNGQLGIGEQRGVVDRGREVALQASVKF